MNIFHPPQDSLDSLVFEYDPPYVMRFDINVCTWTGITMIYWEVIQINVVINVTRTKGGIGRKLQKEEKLIIGDLGRNCHTYNVVTYTGSQGL